MEIDKKEKNKKTLHVGEVTPEKQSQVLFPRSG